jgi:hypothetical protein
VDVPHNVVQCGIGRQDAFFTGRDRRLKIPFRDVIF